MRFDREGKRTVAQFLNGIAVALLTSLVLAPVAAGSARTHTVAIATLAAAVLHLVALVISA